MHHTKCRKFFAPLVLDTCFHPHLSNHRMYPTLDVLDTKILCLYLHQINVTFLFSFPAAQHQKKNAWCPGVPQLQDYEEGHCWLFLYFVCSECL